MFQDSFFQEYTKLIPASVPFPLLRSQFGKFNLTAAQGLLLPQVCFQTPPLQNLKSPLPQYAITVNSLALKIT
jgi:hypothetical protein